MEEQPVALEIYILSPDWLGDEVTGDSRYYNAALTKNPYINWEK